MTGHSTLTDIRRSLVQAADAHFEAAKPYGTARRRLEDAKLPEGAETTITPERYNTAAFTAWIGHLAAANLANTIAALLRQVAEDSSEEYALELAQIVVAAADDGEDAYFANDDVRLSLNAGMPLLTAPQIPTNTPGATP